ncbi:Peptide-methionine (S)-S-oxide reductase [Cladochytrium tenue]|nr:Peptide-methionine (S)-S-oxide reductase [Cladochytrium tenue]
MPPISQQGAGKFWGVDRAFRRRFGDRILNPKVGYAIGVKGDRSDNDERSDTSDTAVAAEPTTGDASTSSLQPAAMPTASGASPSPQLTQETQVLQFDYSPVDLAYDDILDLFFRIHDPLSPSQQGQYYGSEYRSVIFTHSPAQRSAALRFIQDRVAPTWGRLGPVITAVEALHSFEPSGDPDDFDWHTKHPDAVGDRDPCRLPVEVTWAEIEERVRHATALPETEDEDEDAEPEPFPDPDGLSQAVEVPRANLLAARRQQKEQEEARRQLAQQERLRDRGVASAAESVTEPEREPEPEQSGKYRVGYVTAHGTEDGLAEVLASLKPKLIHVFQENSAKARRQKRKFAESG